MSLSAISDIKPRVVYPDSPPTDEPVLEPDLGKYPWFEFVVHRWSKRTDRTGEEEKVVEDTFNAFSELPAEFDAWSKPLKHAPPEFFLGWPLDMDLVRSYAFKNNIAHFCNRVTNEGVKVRGGHKQAHEVTPDDILHRNKTVSEMQYLLRPRAKIEEAYGVPDVEGRFGAVWSLCSNWTPPDQRPKAADIAKLQEELGYKEGPKWYMTTFA
ncbi:hypothetical protein PUNSTDRAFT_138340 [Punctularia strigosozonata HHB-11173 SS5]|uniref:Uncharacterized protein n=1 Tax=Punctularia strigosozonata (strain HHB-11173) TaxID=741275 RepID=R7S5J7_PUNST|nr:uncharacterized protein PUNSTDRAFT_138340 [Punctularia strigosozonata HHB-11173 SS5]EIN04696.1 hypothetical protein PUNSTDRAFT_138340 [Punctularia strigosozonata HHB-11173 SS5]